MPARISVVVRVTDGGAAQFDGCLQSLAAQTVTELDVVIVADGTSAASVEVAQEWARRDSRFRVIDASVAGTGSVRDMGVAATDGEFLAFVDGNDVVPRHGYELLLASLESSGSDFATGGVQRVSERGVSAEPSVAALFARSRAGVRLVEVRRLLADRWVTNKAWRRSFWDEQSLGLPDGDAYSDAQVVLRAHLLARSVDVVAGPVYQLRAEDDDEVSSAQRLTEIENFRRWWTATEATRAMLRELGRVKVARWYDAGVVRHDAARYLDVLDIADTDHRREVVTTLSGFATDAHPGAFEVLPPVERLTWHLVGRGLVEEVVEVLDVKKQNPGRTVPVRVGERWYADLPYRGDAALAIPDDVYELDVELAPVVSLEAMTWTGAGLRLEGYAYLGVLGAAQPGSQRIRVTAASPRWPRLRVPLVVRRIHRPDVTAGAALDLDWSGFSAVLPRGLLRIAARFDAASWQLSVEITGQGLRRSTPTWRPARSLDRRVVERRVGAKRVMRAALPAGNSLAVGIAPRSPRLTSIDSVDGSLRVEGECGGAGNLATLTVSSSAGEQVRTYAVESGSGRFTAVIPLADLTRGPGSDVIDDVEWAVAVLDSDGTAHDLGVEIGEQAPLWPLPGGRELAAYPNRFGALHLIERSARPVIDSASWTAQGQLVLDGRFGLDPARHEAVLRSRRGGEEHVVGFDAAGAGRFAVRFSPARLPGRFGSLPLEPGTWSLQLRETGSSDQVPFAADPGLVRRPAGTHTVDGHAFRLDRSGVAAVDLVAVGDLSDAERGTAHQDRLRTVRYAAATTRLRDAVTYLSFNGRQYSDNPRAIYEQLAGSSLEVEHLWVVRQGRCRVPAGPTVLRELSAPYYDALATSCLIVTNDYLPSWFVPRPGQTVLQTWHGHPLKLIGLDKTAVRKVNVASARSQAQAWTHLLSPSPVATPILAGAFDFTGTMLQTGYPRTDVLLGPDVAERAAAIRDRIGVPAGKRAVLYMPTYRDQLAQGNARYALNRDLDLELLRRELSGDHVLLFRKHHYVVGASLTEPDDFVIDVSAYPDATELLLAADVLVTDYSSAMFDWMSTGRPIVYFVPDLEYYRDELRGFYFDIEAEGPGPFARTSAAVVEALRSVDATTGLYAQRYADFRSTYCGLDDGGASARVADALRAVLDGSAG